MLPKLTPHNNNYYYHLYILRGFRMLFIVFLTNKNTPNLINLSLFLKNKKMS